VSAHLRSRPGLHFVVGLVEERGLGSCVVVVIPIAGVMLSQTTLDLLVPIRLLGVATEPVTEEHDELRKRRVCAADVQDRRTFGIVKESLRVKRGVSRIARARDVPINTWRIRPSPMSRYESGRRQQDRELIQRRQIRHPHLQIDDRFRSESWYRRRPDVVIDEAISIGERSKSGLQLFEEHLRTAGPARLIIHNHGNGHEPKLPRSSGGKTTTRSPPGSPMGGCWVSFDSATIEVTIDPADRCAWLVDARSI
jgi:hypothetical protein